MTPRSPESEAVREALEHFDDIMAIAGDSTPTGVTEEEWAHARHLLSAALKEINAPRAW